METAALIGDERLDPAAVLAFTGTLALYGLDRFLERRHQRVTAPRHHAPARLNAAMMVLIGAGGLAVAPRIHVNDVIWVGWLVLGGLLYCAVTLGRFRLFPGGKEGLGALCFAAVALLNHPGSTLWMWPPFLLMGFGNFAWASHGDFARDRANQLTSGGDMPPRWLIPAARFTSVAAALGFWVGNGPWQLFSWVALAQAIRPRDARWNIDWCFVPLLPTLFR
ncbi:hypothetical protein [Acanthopleuribacter pedis]|uniref:Uncharacterized protein n=1 Tax=Acanthopleuribacter pedis TaxID=442870 RepID=A0A8J7QIW7_9BACT|nr:hypothetical protein [Acanthopleuribacter pedis]MBO1321611.1 hypothetical protein [Acanthopleuribacter pedis]